MKKVKLLVVLLCSVSYLYADRYHIAPQETYEERKRQYLEYCIDLGSKGGRSGVFNEIARMEAGMKVNEHVVRNCIDFIYTGRDCNDFAMAGILRLICLNKKKNVLSAGLLSDMEKCIKDFKYWWDDKRKDKEYRCYHTENHQALCHSDELLAGQLYKQDIFGSGMRGEEHVSHSITLLNHWLEHRFKFGFSEWLSNSYYDVEVLLLANLYDFSEDEQIKQRAGIILDLLMFDMALNNFQGAFGSSHGRTYVKDIKGSRQEATSPIMKLVFGVGVYNSSTSMGTSSLVSSNYRCPEVIVQIATDYTLTSSNKQRSSINAEDAPLYGISYTQEPECHIFWGMQEFIHPLVIETSKRLSHAYDVWPYNNYDQFIRKYDGQRKEHGKVITPHLDLFALSEANVETYRTPHYMLSSVQDYRKGARGYQQHIWQATLSPDATVFTTYPGSLSESGSPNYWSGNGIMPRVAQHKNVLICVYNTPENEKRDFTHAFIPQYAFDEVMEMEHWIMARKNDGYIALYSHHPIKKQMEKHGSLHDYIARGYKNVWICELGSKEEWGSFERFVQALCSAHVVSDDLNATYASPSLGEIKFGWDTPLFMQGEEIAINRFPRYDNPYCKAEFPATVIVIKKGEKQLTLDYGKARRNETKSME